MTEQDTPKMTHDEMIDALKGLVFGTFDRTTAKEREALDMAISALSENKGNLISRQAVLDELNKWDWQDLYLPIHFKQILDDIPPVENRGTVVALTCPKCMKSPKNAVRSDFCPNCGADMREPKCETCKNCNKAIGCSKHIACQRENMKFYEPIGEKGAE